MPEGFVISVISKRVCVPTGPTDRGARACVSVYMCVTDRGGSDFCSAVTHLPVVTRFAYKGQEMNEKEGE